MGNFEWIILKNIFTVWNNRRVDEPKNMRSFFFNIVSSSPSNVTIRYFISYSELWFHSPTGNFCNCIGQIWTCHRSWNQNYRLNRRAERNWLPRCPHTWNVIQMINAIVWWMVENVTRKNFMIVGCIIIDDIMDSRKDVSRLKVFETVSSR